MEAPKKKKKGEEEEEEFKSPLGIVTAHFATSTFAQPNWLRSLLRSGLPGHFVFDLENCHLAVLRERHQPAADSALETYFQDREHILRDTHADRAVAKQLFLRLLYGGSILAWKRTHRLGEFATEQFAERFAAEMAAMRQADCQNHTQLLAKLRQRTARPVEYLQYALNTARERELIDKVVLRLGEHHNTAVLAFDFRYTVKPTMPLREALQAAARVMRSGSPGLERMFDQVDSRWLEHHGIVRQAFKGSLQYHGLFGEVVLRSPAVSSKIPYSLKDIFKFIVDTGHKAWFSATLKTWILTGDSAISEEGE